MSTRLEDRDRTIVRRSRVTASAEPSGWGSPFHSCRACNVEPYAYLLHVLTELPQRAPDADVTDLLPFNCARLIARTRNPA